MESTCETDPHRFCDGLRPAVRSANQPRCRLPCAPRLTPQGQFIGLRWPLSAPVPAGERPHLPVTSHEVPPGVHLQAQPASVCDPIPTDREIGESTSLTTSFSQA